VFACGGAVLADPFDSIPQPTLDIDPSAFGRGSRTTFAAAEAEGLGELGGYEIKLLACSLLTTSVAEAPRFRDLLLEFLDPPSILFLGHRIEDLSRIATVDGTF
jgi:hypothetical protein